MKHQFNLDLEVNDDPGMMLTSELATIDDPDSPVSQILVGFPAPLAYEFVARSGRRYTVNLNPVIQKAIGTIGELEASQVVS